MSDFSEQTRRALRHRIAVKQATGRIPGVYAAVTRDGAIAYGTGIGSANLNRPDDPPTKHTRYQIASITKTFTAVLVMALRDEGKLTLEDTIDQHVPESRHQQVSIRSMLAHLSGMQREPVGDIWDTLSPVAPEDLVPDWNRAERVLPAQERSHYSNLVYAMLGEVVARVDGRPWAESLQARILDPLGMRDTSLDAGDADSGTYFVPPYSDVAVDEPILDTGAIAPAAGLRSTATNLATWLGFLADPTDEVLSPDTVDEMCNPHALSDLQTWSAARGLGLQLVRHQGRLFVGHPGGMPGQITGAMVDRESGTGGVVLMNADDVPSPVGFATDLATYAIEHEPVDPPVWRPGPPVPEDLADVLGRWYAEGNGHDFSVRKGRLESRVVGAPAGEAPAVFERIDTDLFRTVSGRETGELLRITRDPDGSVSHLSWATYRFTRDPLPFGGWH